MLVYCTAFRRMDSNGEISMVDVVLIEAQDLVAADWGGTSDPYVSARYGNIKMRTKVS